MNSHGMLFRTFATILNEANRTLRFANCNDVSQAHNIFTTQTHWYDGRTGTESKLVPRTEAAHNDESSRVLTSNIILFVFKVDMDIMVVCLCAMLYHFIDRSGS